MSGIAAASHLPHLLEPKHVADAVVAALQSSYGAGGIRGGQTLGQVFRGRARGDQGQTGQTGGQRVQVVQGVDVADAVVEHDSARVAGGEEPVECVEDILPLGQLGLET